jgi:hypothetical protein
MPTPTLLQGVLIGALATLFMDVLNLAGSRTGAVGLFRPAFLGRWVGHMFRGTFTHSDIRAAPPIRWELALGELAHYSIGGALGAFYLLLSEASGVSPRADGLGHRVRRPHDGVRVVPHVPVVRVWGVRQGGPSGDGADADEHVQPRELRARPGTPREAVDLIGRGMAATPPIPGGARTRDCGSNRVRYGIVANTRSSWSLYDPGTHGAALPP